MGFFVDNAVILAAGTSSRFVPLSHELPKALLEVRGEILIERQIRQLQEASIPEIIVVVGYQKEKFAYLREKFGVTLIENDTYLTRNNNGSIYAVRHLLKNSYICSSDNYFTSNPFERQVEDSYYAAVYAKGPTAEWCMQEEADGTICGVTIGGADAWYMYGHVFWSEPFSRSFIRILEAEYHLPQTAPKLWESIYLDHLAELKMKVRKYGPDDIFEFDTLDELRAFDASYISNTRSALLKKLAKKHAGLESELTHLDALKGAHNDAVGFTYQFRGKSYQYLYADADGVNQE